MYRLQIRAFYQLSYPGYACTHIPHREGNSMRDIPLFNVTTETAEGVVNDKVLGIEPWMPGPKPSMLSTRLSLH